AIEVAGVAAGGEGPHGGSTVGRSRDPAAVRRVAPYADDAPAEHAGASGRVSQHGLARRGHDVQFHAGIVRSNADVARKIRGVRYDGESGESIDEPSGNEHFIGITESVATPTLQVNFIIIGIVADHQFSAARGTEIDPRLSGHM